MDTKVKRSLIGAVARFTEFLGIKEGVKNTIVRFGEASGLFDALIEKKLKASFRRASKYIPLKELEPEVISKANPLSHPLFLP